MKRILSVLICLVLIVSPVFSVTGYASYNSEIETKANIVLLFSLDNGTVIFDKNANVVTAPASLTKITTAILAIEKCEDLDVTVTAPDYCISLLNGTGSSMAGIKAGEQLTLRQLLECMMVKSANEAANIIADYIGGGSIENFVAMMNDFVTSLGCENTHYVNAHGLDDEGQYTTANDLALIVKHALTLPVFMEICDQYKFTLPPTNINPKERNFTSTNWILNPSFKTYYYEYVHGIKTGTTSGAGHCVITKASKDGYNYLCIVMGAPEEDLNGDNNPENLAFIETVKLYKWVYKNIRLEKIADPTQIVTVVDVKLSFKKDHVRLVPKEEVNALVPTGTGDKAVLIEAIPESTKTSVNAPVKKGEVLGKARIMYAETEIATVDLVAAEDVRANPLLFVLNILKVIVTSPIFLCIFAVAVIVFAVWFTKRQKEVKRRRRAGKAPKMYDVTRTAAKSQRPPQKRNNSNNRRR
ncbi:MAG: D-alanyl-D-alanine carboxypeptidase [Ruminococcaceae bacterium]|nr:D-alanyl-D-alanine carboxypeptidase [Oscillospiraceae bacterium]